MKVIVILILANASGMVLFIKIFFFFHNYDCSLLLFIQCRTSCILFDKYYSTRGDARGVMVIVVGNGHGDSSSNPGRD